MDETLKMYLERIDKNIIELRQAMDGDIRELKEIIEKLREKVENIQIEYVDIEDVEKIKNEIYKKIEELVTKEYCNNKNCNDEISIKKITLICGGISTICITLIEIIKKLIP